MFDNDQEIIGQEDTIYNSKCVDKTYARIDKEGEEGYLTSIENYDEPERLVLTKMTDTNYMRGTIAKDKIESIEFKKGTKADITATIVEEFDASEKNNGKIMGYYTDKNKNGSYELTIMSEDTIYANRDSSALFHMQTGLKSIKFDNFVTDKVVFTYAMFMGCTGLTSIDLSTFDTSRVQNMNNMFKYCRMTTLDLSTFDTSKKLL